MLRTIRFRLNGRDLEVLTDDRRMLVWVLVRELGLGETKFGCGEGQCGSCTVMVDRKAIRSCMLQVDEVEGRDVLTVEGLPEREELQSLAKALADHGGLECEFCTPGMVFNAYSLLLDNPQPSREQILIHLDRSMCRCGATAGLVEAIQAASRQLAAR
jgi:aerobic-type carbon monoxide dehydrogenase small subunit (CoxS/CutS family)